jgi:hypothetical protein
MKITLYAEKSLGINLDGITENMMKLAPSLLVVKGKSSFSIITPFISKPQAYQQLSPIILAECKDSDCVILFTRIRYENNYFWEGFENKAIISFWGWEYLTNLSLNNGSVFFLCATILQELAIGIRHEENTGCINDLWMNKTAVDLGMRTGSICSICINDFQKHFDKSQEVILKQIEDILIDLSIASRGDMDICEFWKLKPTQQGFDVFLCHNSQDKEVLREVNSKLKTAGIKTWFDEEQLPPGRLWQELLEEQIGQIKTAAVFVGPSGMGPWQDMEIRAFLTEFVKRRCPIIPVILAECSFVPQLPIFLRQFTWVDFRKIVPDPFKQLLWGITGIKV